MNGQQSILCYRGSEIVGCAKNLEVSGEEGAQDEVNVKQKPAETARAHGRPSARARRRTHLEHDIMEDRAQVRVMMKRKSTYR
jgi:hypothetical protein